MCDLVCRLHTSKSDFKYKVCPPLVFDILQDLDGELGRGNVLYVLLKFRIVDLVFIE